MIRKKMNNLKVRTKVIALAVFLLIVAVLITVMSINEQIGIYQHNMAKVDKTIRDNYDKNIKNQVQTVVSLLQGFYDKQKAGEYSEEQAKKMAADLVRNLRYEGEGYFWIDTYNGDNIVLLGNETEGTNRLNFQDKKESYIIKELIKAARSDGGGYVDYWFPKNGETKPSPKRGYALAFEPYQWEVGTGNYTDHIDKEIASLKEQANDKLRGNIIGIGIIFLISISAAVAITIYISRRLNKDFNIINQNFNTLSTGNFTIQLPEEFTVRKDEFGTLASNLEKMKESVANLVSSTKNEANGINDIVNAINDNVKELNSNIDDVAATTQELAACMEETAASAQSVTETSTEIETASRSIAQKSQEAALKVIEISKRASDTREDVQESQKQAREMGAEIESKVQKALEQAKIVTQIEALTEAIMGITAQTNILAINAAIEAARAGESGKGFAVVADEIRLLADQSKNTAKKIQNVTGEVTEAVNNLSENSRTLLDYVSSDISASFQKFILVADEYKKDAIYVDGLVTDFSATSEELLASIENIMRTVNEVARAATEGAVGTGDIAEKVMVITNKSLEVTQEVDNSKNISDRLKAEMSNFTI